MELSATAYVILGMLRHEPRSGYDIKAVVDKSTRFFWAASYGQIYPELRKLAAAGLVDGEPQATGGRKRTVYRLTEAGRAELERWLGEPPQVLELRDEGLLKLFFGAAGAPGDAIAAVQARQRTFEEKLAQLRAIESMVAAGDDPYPYLVLRYGIESSEQTIEWCKRAQAELEAAKATQPKRRRARG